MTNSLLRRTLTLTLALLLVARSLAQPAARPLTKIAVRTDPSRCTTFMAHTDLLSDERLLGITDRPVRADETMPEALQCWMEGVQQAADYVDAHPELQLGTAHSSSVVIPRLLGNIQWSQTAPWDRFCPGTSPVGCVATAMAQVMYYWRQPAQGQGQHTWTYGGITHDVNFGETTYQWDLMRDTRSQYQTDEERIAAATLCYHCGVSIDMQYDANSSGTMTEYIPYALKTYFGYQGHMGPVYREDCTYDEWQAALLRELTEGRPIIFSAYSEDGGHAFVVDGINAQGLYHVNWGWGGAYDGYFDICLLNPEGAGTGATITEIGFCLQQRFIANVHPTEAVGEPFCPTRCRYFGADFSKDAVQLECDFENVLAEKIHGRFGFELYDCLADTTVSCSWSEALTMNHIYAYWGHNPSYIGIEDVLLADSLGNGCYGVKALWQDLDDADSTIYVLPRAWYDTDFYFKVEGHQVTDHWSDAYLTPDFHATNLSIADSILAVGADYDVAIDLTNTGTETFAGAVHLTMQSEEDWDSEGYHDGNGTHMERGITSSLPFLKLAPGETQTVHFSIAVDHADQWKALFWTYCYNTGVTSYCDTDTSYIFPSEVNEFSPAALELLSVPTLLTERCEADGEVSFSLEVSNLNGGNFSDQIGMLIFKNKTKTEKVALSLTELHTIPMKDVSSLTITGTLTGLKAMTKYYARPYYTDQHGEWQPLLLDGEPVDPIELKVYGPSAIESVRDDAPASTTPVFDLLGRPLPASSCPAGGYSSSSHPASSYSSSSRPASSYSSSSPSGYSSSSRPILFIRDGHISYGSAATH